MSHSAQEPRNVQALKYQSFDTAACGGERLALAGTLRRHCVVCMGFAPTGRPHLGTLRIMLRAERIKSLLASVGGREASTVVMTYPHHPIQFGGRARNEHYLPLDAIVNWADRVAPADILKELASVAKSFRCGAETADVAVLLRKEGNLTRYLERVACESNWASSDIVWYARCHACSAYVATRANEFERNSVRCLQCRNETELVIRYDRGKLPWVLELPLTWDIIKATHVVAGAELERKIRRAIDLSRKLGFEVPRFCVESLVYDAHGRKMSKSVGNGIIAADAARVVPWFLIKRAFELLDNRQVVRLDSTWPKRLLGLVDEAEKRHHTSFWPLTVPWRSRLRTKELVDAFLTTPRHLLRGRLEQTATTRRGRSAGRGSKGVEQLHDAFAGVEWHRLSLSSANELDDLPPEHKTVASRLVNVVRAVERPEQLKERITSECANGSMEPRAAFELLSWLLYGRLSGPPVEYATFRVDRGTLVRVLEALGRGRDPGEDLATVRRVFGVPYKYGSGE